MTVGLIGAGRMGLPMVARLAGTGSGVNVLVRSSATRAAVGEIAGARPVSGVTELVAGVEAVVICVHKDDEVRQVIADTGLLAAMPADSVLIVHTTGSPFTVRELASQAAEYDVAVVDAPVSGGPPDIERGEITVFMGGEDAAVAKARAVVSAYADPIFAVGPLGGGQLVKLVNNSVFLSNIEILVSAVEFGKTQGLDVATMIQCLQRGSAASRALDGVARAGSPVDFRRNVGEFLEKDAAVVLQVAAEVGADLGVVEQLLRPDRPPAKV